MRMDRPGHYSRIMQPDTDPRPANWDSARITPAIVLISIGVLFLLSNLHLIPGMNWFDFWPVILIVLAPRGWPIRTGAGITPAA